MHWSYISCNNPPMCTLYWCMPQVSLCIFFCHVPSWMMYTSWQCCIGDARIPAWITNEESNQERHGYLYIVTIISTKQAITAFIQIAWLDQRHEQFAHIIYAKVENICKFWQSLNTTNYYMNGLFCEMSPDVKFIIRFISNRQILQIP